MPRVKHLIKAKMIKKDKKKDKVNIENKVEVDL